MSNRFPYYKEEKIYRYYRNGYRTRIYIQKKGYNIFHVINGDITERSCSTLKNAKNYILQNHYI